MRIITGTAKGFRLKAPRGLDVRPTGDRVKESVFNIISNHIEQADVLDLFAGTGNLGLEALSRGAKGAVFVDSAATSLSVLKENALHTCLAERSAFIKADALKAIDRLFQDGRKFDLIFCDPPYNKGFVLAILAKIDEKLILKPGGILILEHSKHEPCNIPTIILRMMRREEYGETVMTFFTTDPDNIKRAYDKEDS